MAATISNLQPMQTVEINGARFFIVSIETSIRPRELMRVRLDLIEDQTVPDASEKLAQVQDVLRKNQRSFSL